MARPHVVVIGAGFGGLRVAKGLRGHPVDVTLIDSNNFHTFQPLLYQVATAGLEAGDVSFPARGILRRNPSAQFVRGAVTGIDVEHRRVEVDRQRWLSYDYLVVAAGSVSTDYGVAGVADHSFPLKTLHDALALRAHVLSKWEAASAAVLAGEPLPELGLVIVGGGPTGVELAGGMRELFDGVLAKDFPELDTAGTTRITLVEAARRVLPPFDPTSSRKAEQTLRDRGVDVITGVGVDHVEPGVVVLADGRRLDAGTIVWAAGVTANPLATMLGAELVKGGRLAVADDLSIGGNPDVFAIGDIAAANSKRGEVLPQVAQPAIQGGHHVARQIVRDLAGKPRQRFTYFDKGSMATIGRNQAITELPFGLRIYGRLGWLAWLGLHILYLIGFRNRIAVLVNWAWNYVTYDRGARALIEQQPDREPPPR
jgi:NADH dehydrogenase